MARKQGRPRKPTRHDSVEAVYKIRRSDGLYSTGGSTPCFKKFGKAWTNLAHVKSHLRGVGLAKTYVDCVIVVFVLQEAGEPVSVKEWIEKMRMVDAL